MISASEQLCAELLSLPEKDRAELTGLLIDSLGCPPTVYSDDDPDFIDELARREQEIRDGTVVGVAAEEVFCSAG